MIKESAEAGKAETMSLIMATVALALQGAGAGWNAEIRKAGVMGVAKLLDEGYAHPELGRRLAMTLRERETRGDYAKMASGEEMARKLTDELQSLSHDRHLWVDFSPEVFGPEPELTPGYSKEWLDGAREQFRRENYGLQKTEILPGNVGYIDFRKFMPLEIAAETYQAAMATVANTDALIIDLRQGLGSMSPDTIPMLMGYFFERPTHLSDLKWRFEKETRQYWSAASVPGKRYLEKPLYVLVSGATFSGPEGMAYDLQALKRATIIGEPTGGEANPNMMRRASDHFSMSLPSGLAKNAVTGSNWEGKGVQPDLSVPAVAALRVAQGEALKKLRDLSSEPEKGRYEDAVREVKASAKPLREIRFALAGFAEAKSVSLAGTFNYWTPRSSPMRREDGAWIADVTVEPGRLAYKFVVDGRWMPDPANPDHMGASPDSDSVRKVD